MGAVYSQFFVKLALPSSSATRGKTILITGANTGLGREAARHALNLGANVILGVRSLSKGEEAKADIAPGDLSANVLFWPIDLESFASVRAFAARARDHVANGGRLDAAIMNAGLASVEWITTKDGWERGLQVNVLSTALLSLEILPVLLEARKTHPSSSSERPHLTILASDIHKTAKFPERDADGILAALNSREQWEKTQQVAGSTERYAITKLLDIFVTIEIAALVPRDERGDPLVIINCLAPGFCKSNLLSREEGVPLIVKIILFIVGRSVEEGSKTILHAVTQGVESHGKWIEDQIIRDPGKIVTASEMVVVRKKIWGELLAVLTMVDPELRTDAVCIDASTGQIRTMGYFAEYPRDYNGDPGTTHADQCCVIKVADRHNTPVGCIREAVPVNTVLRPTMEP
ncbi:hypothetical protein BDV12DRAFT_195355 [Aspergillus spectabilis]